MCDEQSKSSPALTRLQAARAAGIKVNVDYRESYDSDSSAEGYPQPEAESLTVSHVSVAPDFPFLLVHGIAT